EALDSGTGLTGVVVGKINAHLPVAGAVRHPEVGIVTGAVAVDVLRRRHVAAPVVHFGVGEGVVVDEREIQTGGVHVVGERVAVGLVAVRDTEAVGQLLLGLLDEVVAETDRGHVVEVDVLDAVETGLVAQIPRRATREVVGVIDAGLELVGGIDAVALATVVGGVELEDLAGAGALGADGKLGAELLAVAGLAADIDRGLVGPLRLEGGHRRIGLAGLPGGGELGHRGRDGAVLALDRHGAVARAADRAGHG